MQRAAPWRPVDGGLELQVKVTTNARAGEAVEGTVVDEHGAVWLALRVRARPVEGQANAAILTFFAKALGCPRRAMSIRRGERSRWKSILAEGDPALLEERCAALLASGARED